MQRQSTSIELEATSLNHYFQDVGVPDGVDDRGLGLAYWSYFHRKMAFKERHYVESISREPSGIHYPSCPCCTGWVKNAEGLYELKWYQGMILVMDGNFKLKHLLHVKSLYEMKEPFIMYDDDPVVIAILRARADRGMPPPDSMSSSCSTETRSFRGDGDAGSLGRRNFVDENGVMVGMCSHGFTTRLMGITQSENFVYGLSLAVDVLSNMFDIRISLTERTLERTLDHSKAADVVLMKEALHCAYDIFNCRFFPHVALTLPCVHDHIDGSTDPMHILMHTGKCQVLNATKVSRGLANTEICEQRWARDNVLAGALARMTAFARRRALSLNMRLHHLRIGKALAVTVSNRVLYSREMQQK
jgi:hypothetical protein